MSDSYTVTVPDSAAWLGLEPGDEARFESSEVEPSPGDVVCVRLTSMRETAVLLLYRCSADQSWGLTRRFGSRDMTVALDDESGSTRRYFVSRVDSIDRLVR